MSLLGDIRDAAVINIPSAIIFLVAFSILRLQPFNDRVYFPKFYRKGLRSSPSRSGASVRKGSYLKLLNWIPEALKMPEHELIDHAGLDSAVCLRIYLLGLKIFVPITLLAWLILVPVNWTNPPIYSNVDKLSILNIPRGSQKLWAHIIMAYIFTIWTCYVLRKEYERVASTRLDFLASERRSPDQFTVLVRNIPPDPDKSISELVEHFFLVSHPDNYLTHQVVYNTNKLAKLVKLVKKKKKKQNRLDGYELKYSRDQSKRPIMKIGFLGLCGDKVNAIEYETSEIERLSKEIAAEQERVIMDAKSIMPAAFVSFKGRWAAAVCAHTKQSRDPTAWLTEWAPQPRDVYWQNLAIPDVQLTIKRLIIAVAFFFLTFFFMIPIAFVHSLNIEVIERAPFLKGITKISFIKSFIQGVLPGLALKLYLASPPYIFMLMSKFEGFISISSLQRRLASRCYIFNFMVVLLGSTTNAAFDLLNGFLKQSEILIPADEIIGAVIRMNATFLGEAIPMSATLFITYIMVDWVGIAGEILRLKPLIFYHFKNFFLVKTEKDREEAMDPGSLGLYTHEPEIQLYFLLGLIYAVVAPLVLPFILVLFGFGYLVLRHQIINVYSQEYESGAEFWPDIHGRVITTLVSAQLLLMVLIGTKGAPAKSSLFWGYNLDGFHFAKNLPSNLTLGNFELFASLIALPVLTIWFHRFCKGRYEPAFIRHPLQETMMKDTLDCAREPNLNLKRYLQNAYIHPVFKACDDDEDQDQDGDFNESGEEKSVLVLTNSQLRRIPPRTQQS